MYVLHTHTHTHTHKHTHTPAHLTTTHCSSVESISGGGGILIEKASTTASYRILSVTAYKSVARAAIPAASAPYTK
jgi:hypothetical protein